MLPAWVALAAPAPANLESFPRYTEHAPTVPVYRVATGGVLHRFFDTSPISPSGRYLALFRPPAEGRSPRPGEAGDVVLVDLQSGKERVVAQSRGWEVQVGANVQWGASDSDLLFNDVDPSDWSDFAVHVDPVSGNRRRLGGTVFMVSPDGRTLASYNLRASRFAQVGYGVVVPDDRTRRNFGPVSDDAITLTDVATGQAKRILTIADVYRQLSALHVSTPAAHEFYFFQVKWNPQATRLLATLQWSPKPGSRRRAVITFRPDGSDVRLAVTPEQWARGGHHINWMPDGEHLSMNLDVDEQPGLELISVRHDGREMNVLFKPGSGHPSQHPGGRPFFVTDAYPNEPVAGKDGTSPIRLLDLQRQKEHVIARVFVSMASGEFRVDPHPAWDRTGRFVIFNGFVGGTRNVFVADVSSLLVQ